jgi:hypothetical protein
VPASELSENSFDVLMVSISLLKTTTIDVSLPTPLARSAGLTETISGWEKSFLKSQRQKAAAKTAMENRAVDTVRFIYQYPSFILP